MSAGSCQTWNPKSSGVGSFDYIDLSSVDKVTKSIASIERYECSDAQPVGHGRIGPKLTTFSLPPCAPT